MKETRALSPLAMIIEDDEKLSIIYSEAIKKAGFATRTVRRGDVALQELKIFRPSLVILDLHLPYVSGETILKAIRSDPYLRETRVILTTADAVMAKMLDDEGDLVLVKPVSFTQLRELAYRLAQNTI